VRWIGLAADALLACSGIVFLLYAYRVLGKPLGADEKYDAAMAHQSPNYKVFGWAIVAMALIGISNHLVAVLL
jgi:hypothetical protein